MSFRILWRGFQQDLNFSRGCLRVFETASVHTDQRIGIVDADGKVFSGR